MSNKITILAIAFFAIIKTAYGQYCTKDTRYTEAQFFDSSQITVGANIQYGIASDFQGNPDTLRMDLYYPGLAIDLSPRRPFIMLFHGGGFSSGDKQSGDIRDLCIHLALRGFVCASVNYRLGHDFSEYGQYKARYRAIQDGHAALRFIVNNANAVRIDTAWIFVGGQSAGSLLALGMVYADQSELDSVSLQYNAASAGVELGNLLSSGNNLSSTYTIKGIFNNWGGAVKSEIDGHEMLPTIAFHGQLDTLVPIDSDHSFLHYTLNGSRALHNDLNANGVCSELSVDTVGEHGIYRNAASKFRAQRASCFFKSIFCKTCSALYTTDSIPSDCSNLLSVGDTKFESKIKVFPNPFENTFRIEGGEGALEIRIYNSVGQLVFREIVLNAAIQTDLLPGIYVLNIIQADSNNAFTTKLIKY